MSDKRKRVNRRQQRVREDILDVTRKLVLKQGLTNLTLTAIAHELDLTKAALYYYFDSKDALLFELVFGSLQAEAAAVEAAVATATTGAEAVEQLIRTVAGHYARRLDDFRLTYLAGQVGAGMIIGAELLERIRPLNHRIYGRAEELIRRDQEAGLIAAGIHARRAVFLAHCAVLGVLTLEGVVDVGDESPLIHAHDDLIDDLVNTHTAQLRPTTT